MWWFGFSKISLVLQFFGKYFKNFKVRIQKFQFKNFMFHRIIFIRHIPCDERTPEKPTAVLSPKKKRSLQERFSFLRGRIDDVMSDNTMISVYPLGRNYFCFYESPFLQQVEIELHWKTNLNFWYNI